MWNPFRRKPLLTDEDLLFQIETYRWLLTHFGGDHFYRAAQLILPTREYFPASVTSSESAAKSTFEQVKKFAGMSSWPCRLVPQQEDINPVIAPSLVLRNAPATPLGTFSGSEDGVITITYNPRITADPTQMVATFAHELAHYLTGTAPEPPPGGWENWEFATDIAASFLGFGIFVANAAFNFQQYTAVYSHGWQYSRSGYLTEAEYSFALALFLRLKAIAPEVCYPHCNPNIRSFLRKALSELNESSRIAELRATPFSPQSVAP